MRERIQIVSKSNPGRKRDYQEDSFGHPRTPLSAIDIKRGVLLIVADGVGGHESGDIASRIAVEAIEEYFRGHLQSSITESLKQARFKCQ